MKKFIMLLMMVFLVVSSGTSAFASTPAIPKIEDCECGEVTETPEGITELDKKEAKKSADKLNQNETFREASKWLKEEGVELDTKNVAGLHMEELQFSSGETFDDVKHIAINAMSVDNEDRGLIIAIVDNDTNEVLNIKANLFYNVSEDGFSHLQTYTMDDGLGEKVSKEELDSAKDGQFSTQAFSPCVHVSIWLCIYHCGIWALATGAVGGTVCAAICAYAFTYACS